MEGILLINKPKDWTSRDVVNKVGHIFNTKKVGHTGTLDPLATGVLVVCLGKYTKLVEELTCLEKEYIATMKLGVLTDTLDVTGNVLKEEEVKVRKEQIIEVFSNFSKEYIQEVPIYSAVKVNGKKLYEYAREGLEVELPKKLVQIKSLEVLDIKDNYITFKTRVSKGTYIRSLINDLAKNLGTVAIMSDLQRTEQGMFSIENCLNIEDITNDCLALNVTDIFNYPVIHIDDVMYQKVLNGNKIKLDCMEDKVFISYKDNIIAIYQKSDDEYKIIFKLV